MADDTKTPTAAAPADMLLARAELHVIRGKHKDGSPKTVTLGPGLIDGAQLEESERAHFHAAGVLYSQDELMELAIRKGV